MQRQRTDVTSKKKKEEDYACLLGMTRAQIQRVVSGDRERERMRSRHFSSRVLRGGGIGRSRPGRRIDRPRLLYRPWQKRAILCRSFHSHTMRDTFRRMRKNCVVTPTTLVRTSILSRKQMYVCGEKPTLNSRL